MGTATADNLVCRLNEHITTCPELCQQAVGRLVQLACEPLDSVRLVSACARTHMKHECAGGRARHATCVARVLNSTKTCIHSSHFVFQSCSSLFQFNRVKFHFSLWYVDNWLEHSIDSVVLLGSIFGTDDEAGSVNPVKDTDDGSDDDSKPAVVESSTDDNNGVCSTRRRK
jgi:hypothetical protein